MNALQIGGVTPGSLLELSRAIGLILRARCDEETKRAALKALSDGCAINTVSVCNNRFDISAGTSEEV